MRHKKPKPIKIMHPLSNKVVMKFFIDLFEEEKILPFCSTLFFIFLVQKGKKYRSLKIFSCHRKILAVGGSGFREHHVSCKEWGQYAAC